MFAELLSGGLVSALTTIGGGVIGMIGSQLTKREDRKIAETKARYDLETAKLDIEESKIERDHELAMADKQMGRAQHESEINLELSADDTFRESMKFQTIQLKSEGMEIVRGSVRPALVAYLVIANTVIFVMAHISIGGLSSLPQDDVVEIYKLLIVTFSGLLSLSVSWYFGSRPSGVRK